RRLAGEKVCRARESGPCRVHDARRKDVLFLQAEDLFTKSDEVRAERIENGCCVAVAVVNRVDAAEGILFGKGAIQPHGSEVLPDDLRGTVEILLYAVLTGDLGVRR